MAVVQPVFRHSELFIGIEDNEVSIVASGDSAFARTSRQFRGLAGHPAGDVLENESATAGLGPHERQR